MFSLSRQSAKLVRKSHDELMLGNCYSSPEFFFPLKMHEPLETL